MKLSIWHDVLSNTHIYEIKIPDYLFAKAKFYSVDRILFDECELSELISDKLLGLETIARRIEEAELEV